MNKKVWIIALLAMASGFVSCSNLKKECVMTVADLDGRWTVESIDGITVKTEKESFFEFNTEEKRIHVYAGCNHLNTTYEIDKTDSTKIKINPAMMTMMACQDMDAEKAFIHIQPEIASLGCTAGEKSILLFLDKDGKELMRLKR